MPQLNTGPLAHSLQVHQFGRFDEFRIQGTAALRVQTPTGRIWSMEILWNDVRYACRMLAKKPGFTFVAVLTLALGIGTNTAVFSVVNGVLLNPLPFPNPDQLVTLYESKPHFETGSITYPNFLDWRKQNHTFSAMAAYRADQFTLTGVGEPEVLRGEMISAEFFSIIGVKPVVGRTFSPTEDHLGAPRTVMISAALWNRKFGSSRAIIGRPMALDGLDYTVVGVIPSTFHLRIWNFRESEVYILLGQCANPRLQDRTAAWGMDGIGRLEPNVNIQQARADMAQITANLAAAYPDANKGTGATLMSLREATVGRVKSVLLVLLAAVVFVLLIACVNIANLLLAHSTGRKREFAVRAALGASQARVVRQLLTESVLLASIGGILGLLAAASGTTAALARLPQGLPRTEEIGIDARVLLFTVAISAIAGILFGLAPAFKTSRPNVYETLKEGGRSASRGGYRAHALFVTAEMAMALVLLIGATLLIRTLAALWSVNPGFTAKNILLTNVALPAATSAAAPDTIRAALRQLDDTLELTPGVQAASLSWGATPMDGDDEQLFWIANRPKPASESEMNWSLDYIVTPHYLKAMEIPLKRGRFFTARDDGHSPLVVVVDDVFAQKFFPNEDPIGKRIILYNPDRPAQIVGVVGHVKQWGLDTDDTNTLRAELYRDLLQMPDQIMPRVAQLVGVVLRTQSAPLALVPAIQRSIRQISPNNVLYESRSMEQMIGDSLAARRFLMILLGIFAVVALGLSSIGLYGVVSYIVGQQTREIGIRVALGAQDGDVLRPILSYGLRMTLFGVATGIAASFAVTRVMKNLLFGVSATDPVTFAAVAIFLMLVAITASYIPARRAMRVDPLIALRYE